uniref:Protein kinase domain-containing protein n=1 Tax=Rhizophagus irregularis (strain DAOM 181602 / DAOM 197198 / MUCL 43194) TaxID=747089 RepID=U9T908_RHIID
MNKENETKVTIEFVSKNLNVSDKDCNSAMTINHKKCSQCDKPFIEESWCKECDPFRMIEGWTSENHDIDEFIKNTIYDEALNYYGNYYPEFLEWVSFDRFEDIKKIGEGGFAKVYSATWIDGRAKYKRQDDEGWKKLDPEPMKVALKNLNGSQSMSAEYLNELQTHWNLNKSLKSSLKFYGMTKDPATKEFMMILQFAEKGNLKCFLSSNFSNFLWKDKIVYLCGLADDLNSLHKLGFFYRDLHSGNILQNISGGAFVSDFGLSGSPNEQKSCNKIRGFLV